VTRSATKALRLRLPLLFAGGAALVAGLYSALLLLGVGVPAIRPSLADVHGPVMVFGFVGTLVALERAVALGARWGLLAPAFSGLGALVLVLTGAGLVSTLLIAASGGLLLGVYRALWGRQPSVALVAQAAGAFAWYIGALLWLAGTPVPELIPWLCTFVVATIAGERLELTHVTLRGPAAERWFLAALAALIAGATAATLWPESGGYMFGVALLAVVAWLAAFDIARHTIHARGLPRYVAAGLLAGYAWLGLAGLLWAGNGRIVGGASYDAALHAVFLGFTMSMIFAHAPVILPAVLRRPLPYRPVLYVPLAVLHLGLLVRVGLGDGAGWEPVWRWAGTANVAAVLGFVACAVTLVAGAPRPTRSTVDGSRPARVPAEVHQ
jgi:hypothetical protein